MTAHNAKNERIKRRYFAFLKEAKRHNEATVDATAMALARFEAHGRFRDFKTFHYEQAIAFKNKLAEQTSRRTGERLSKATSHATLGHLKRFFVWLAGQPGYRSLRYSDAEYFNLSDKDTRVATARREKSCPTLEQVKHVISAMPHRSEVEKRNRALVAFTLLTGARDSAIASLKLKHIDLTSDRVDQDAREVNTKNSKTFATYFFPVGDNIREIVVDWISYLVEQKLWGPDDPLFPATHTVVGASHLFQVIGIKREHWRTASPIRAIFRQAFEGVGLPYFNPHSLRKTLVTLGQTRCKTPEAFKAWSQNIGHENVMTTFTSYGAVQASRQAEIIRDLSNPTDSHVPLAQEIIAGVVRELRGFNSRS
ncbi:MAG TPA: tyrosine-type recombinase/integrase [Vicinamibacterales bacterium]|nr:tyrosine-type recombinase/integrase [Vicinamibacterales bacterium]